MAGNKPKQSVNVVATGIVASEPTTRGAFTSVRFAVSQPGKKVNDEWVNEPSFWFDLMAKGDQLEGAVKGLYLTISGRLSMRMYQDKPQYTVWLEDAKVATVEGAEQSNPNGLVARAEAKTPELAFPE